MVGGFPRGDHVEGPSHREHLGLLRGVDRVLQCHGHFVLRDDVGTVALPGFEQPELDERADGFADRRAADAERLDELRLGGNLAAYRPIAGTDLVAQPVDDGIHQRDAGDLSHVWFPLDVIYMITISSDKSLRYSIRDT